MNNLKVIPLGGLGEVGKNMTAICYKEEIILVDAGTAFPTEDMLGIDIVIPDVEFLRQNKKNFKKIIITHGHEDHIGALPYLLKEFSNVPLYTTKLTAALIRNKLKNSRVTFNKINIINEDSVIKSGDCEISFFRTNHSIPDSVGVVIDTPIGTVVHTGDFKIDYTPLDGRYMDFQRIGEIGKKGVLVMLSDSTNAEKPGVSLSEKKIGQNLEGLIRGSEGRVIVATFASSLFRVQNLIDIAKKLKKKIIPIGRSMEHNVKVALKLGYLTADEDLVITSKQMKDYTKEEIIIVTTGSQGESTSGLARMANGEHNIIELDIEDTVIVSSSPIPGNEKVVGSMIDRLINRGIRVEYGKGEVHTSGHGYQEEQKLMLSILRPKYFIPAHGEHRMLKKHGDLAVEIGIPKENIIICQNGDVVEFTEEGVKTGEKVQAGAVLVDNSGMGDVDEFLMQNRRRLSEHGVAIIQVNCPTHEGRKMKIDVILDGIVKKYDKTSLHEELLGIISKKLEEKDNIGQIKKELYGEIGNVLHKHVKRKPKIHLLINNFKSKEGLKNKVNN